MIANRPTLVEEFSEGLSYRLTYQRVLDAVNGRRKLIHGNLDGGDGYCALGCYFARHYKSVDTQAAKEISAYNDRFPKLSAHKRWRKVRDWLKTQVEVFRATR